VSSQEEQDYDAFEDTARIYNPKTPTKIKAKKPHH